MLGNRIIGRGRGRKLPAPPFFVSLHKNRSPLMVDSEFTGD